VVGYIASGRHVIHYHVMIKFIPNSPPFITNRFCKYMRTEGIEKDSASSFRAEGERASRSVKVAAGPACRMAAPELDGELILRSEA
jgi:hypothetical protein